MPIRGTPARYQEVPVNRKELESAIVAAGIKIAAIIFVILVVVAMVKASG